MIDSIEAYLNIECYSFWKSINSTSRAANIAILMPVLAIVFD
jgi:hypothetical protein